MEHTHQQSKVVDSLPLCGHIYKHGRQCRQPVARPGEVLCCTHLRSHPTATPHVDPLAELASELGEISEIHEVGAFIAKLMKLACQSRITFRRAVSLTYMANSLINAIRLQRAEDVRAAKDPGELRIDWTDVPRPPSDRVNLNQQPLSDTLHTPVPA